MPFTFKTETETAVVVAQPIIEEVNLFADIQAQDTGSQIGLYREYICEEVAKGNENNIETFTQFRERMNS